MAIKTYIDGAEGTTGLQLKQRLLSHPEIQIISADVNKRKDLNYKLCLLYTSPSPRDRTRSRMPSSA